MTEQIPSRPKKKKRSHIIIMSCVIVAFIFIFALVAFQKKSHKNTKNKTNITKTEKKTSTHTTKSSNWESEFIKYRMDNNSDVAKLIIDESVLYIYVKNITSDMDFYCKMYTVQFQKAYKENTGRSNVSSLVYSGNRLLKTWDANNEGLE